MDPIGAAARASQATKVDGAGGPDKPLVFARTALPATIINAHATASSHSRARSEAGVASACDATRMGKVGLIVARHAINLVAK